MLLQAQKIKKLPVQTTEIKLLRLLFAQISRKRTPLPFRINDVAGAETVDYDNDTNISHVSLNKSVQIAAKKILKK